MNIENCILFEGMTSVRAVIESGKRKIVTLLYDSARTEKNPKEFAWLTHRSEDSGFEIRTVERAELDSICEGTTHGGVAAYCRDLPIDNITPDDISDSGFYFMVSGIEDPFNFGYAARSIYAAGADGLIIPKRNWMTAAGTVCRSSAGASERIDIFTLEAETDIAMFKNKGYSIVCADFRDSVSLFEAELSKPILCIVGGEKRGISRTLLDMSDIRVAIPYGRDFPESLSAASACAVTAFEILRRNG